MDDVALKRHLIKKGIRDINGFLSTLSLILTRCPDLNKKNFEEYLWSLHEAGRTENTLNKYTSVIKTYGHFRKWSWVKKLERWKVPYKLVETMSDQEIKDFLAVPVPPETPIKRWKMWTVYFTIQAYSAMREGEVANLTINDIDFGSCNFIIRKAKVEPRLVPIADYLVPILKDHLQTVENYLFPAQRDPTKPVGSSAWHQQFNRRLELLGIKRKGLHPHCIRHSWVTSLLRSGASTSFVKKVAGHKKITTTEMYTHLITEDVRPVVNSHPNLVPLQDSHKLIEKLTAYAQQIGIFAKNDIKYTIEKSKFTVEVVGAHQTT